MKQLKRNPWLPLALALIFLAACGGGAAPSATVDTGPVFTQIAMTALAYQTQTAQAVPTATNTLLATPTLEQTNTPLMTNTLQAGSPTVTPLVLATATGGLSNTTGCDNATFITDVTFKDYSEVYPGAPFTKTWRIRNDGPCTWTQDYRLAFGWGGTGTDWNTVLPVNLLNKVAPGDTVDVSVVLDAPTQSGTYQAAFRMQNSKYATLGAASFFGPTLTVVVVVK